MRRRERGACVVRGKAENERGRSFRHGCVPRVEIWNRAAPRSGQRTGALNVKDDLLKRAKSQRGRSLAAVSTENNSKGSEPLLGLPA